MHISAAIKTLAIAFLATPLLSAARPLVERQDPTVTVAPGNVGTTIEPAYQGPAPSTLNRDRVGPVLLLRSGTMNADGTLTLPLYKGIAASGNTYWYIVTDTSDEGNSEQLGVNFAAKLAFVAQGEGDNLAVDIVKAEDGNVIGRKGEVNFSPVRQVVPGDGTPFPPKVAVAGQVGDDNYTPLIQVSNLGGSVWNAPIIAGNVDENFLNYYCNGIPAEHEAEARTHLHDRVVAICPNTMTVTIRMVQGFSFGRPVNYIVAETSDEGVAAIDGVTYTPRLKKIKVGGDDSLFSAVERIFVASNGPTNKDLPDGGPNNATVKVHPFRQGLYSSVLGEGDPLNVLGGIPTFAYDYSPLWDVNAYEWSSFSIRAGMKTRLREEFEILGLAEQGYITGIGGMPFGSSGIINNCPIVARLL